MFGFCEHWHTWLKPTQFPPERKASKLSILIFACLKSVSDSLCRKCLKKKDLVCGWHVLPAVHADVREAALCTYLEPLQDHNWCCWAWSDQVEPSCLDTGHLRRQDKSSVRQCKSGYVRLLWFCTDILRLSEKSVKPAQGVRILLNLGWYLMCKPPAHLPRQTAPQGAVNVRAEGTCTGSSNSFKFPHTNRTCLSVSNDFVRQYHQVKLVLAGGTFSI